MAFLAYTAGVQPSEFSEDIRRHGMTLTQAHRLERELVKLRKADIDLQTHLAKVSAGIR